MITKMKPYLGVFLLTAVVLALWAGPVRASDLPTTQERVLGAIANAGAVDSGNSTAINLTYLGSGTEAEVTISATAMTFYYNKAGTLIVDPAIGTAGVVTFASTLGSNTMGALCDYINGLYAAGTAKYICTLIGAKRDDAPILLADQTATTGVRNLGAVGGQNFQFEGASTAGLGSAYVIRMGLTPATDRRIVLKQCVVKDVGSSNLIVYGKKRKFEAAGAQSNTIATPAAQISAAHANDNDTTKVWDEPTAAGTALTEDWDLAGDLGGGFEFGKNEHVVVEVGGGGSTVQVSGDYIRCKWEER